MPPRECWRPQESLSHALHPWVLNLTQTVVMKRPVHPESPMTPIWGTVTCPLGQVTSRRGEGMHLFRTLPCLSTGNFPCLGGYLLPAFCPPHPLPWVLLCLGLFPP